MFIAMNSHVWLDYLIQIAIGIAAGLSIAPIQRWLSRRGKTRAQAKREAAELDYFLALYYYANPDLLTQFMIIAAVKASQGFFFLTASFLLEIAAVDILLPKNFVDSTDKWFANLLFVGSVVAIARAAFVLQHFYKAIEMYYDQFAFPVYLDEKVPADIRNLQWEQDAQEKRNMWLPTDPAILNEAKRVQ
jgi:hypothetical protein